MRIDFENNGYLEIKKSDSDKIVIITSVIDQDNPKKKNTHCVDVTKEEFKLMISKLDLE